MFGSDLTGVSGLHGVTRSMHSGGSFSLSESELSLIAGWLVGSVLISSSRVTCVVAKELSHTCLFETCGDNVTISLISCFTGVFSSSLNVIHGILGFCRASDTPKTGRGKHGFCSMFLKQLNKFKNNLTDALRGYKKLCIGVVLAACETFLI